MSINYQFAIVTSQFNRPITDELLRGAVARFQEYGIEQHAITVVKVPGAIEIPLMAQHLAKQKRYHAIICLGAVIQGETDHYQYVCEQVSHGCQTVMLKFHVPIIFGVLTTHNEKEANDRIGGRKGHIGKEAVDAAIRMASLMNEEHALNDKSKWQPAQFVSAEN